MSLLVRLAARTLPRGVRERYREQWLADVRDCAEAGLRPAQIEFAAVAFALTYNRTAVPSTATATPGNRGRVALGLSLAASVLSLSTWVEAGFGSTVGSVSDNEIYDYLVFLFTVILTGFALVAGFTALVLIVTARGIQPRLRLAVWLLVAASTAPIVKGAVDAGRLEGSTLVTPGALAYLVGALCVIVALVLTRQPASAGAGRATVAAGVVAVAASAGFVAAMQAWSNRVPFFNGAPRNAENEAVWLDWQQLQQSGEDFVGASFLIYAAIGAIAVLSVALAGRRSPVAATLMGLATLSIALGGLCNILRMMERDVVAETTTALLLLIGRIVLVAVVLYAVGGLRLTRVRHRHDVEGAVELL